MMDEIMKRLQEPFKQEDIEWRIQRSIRTNNGDIAYVAAYVTNRAIMNRLDEVCGVAGWKNEYKEWRNVGVLCGLSLKIEDEWITKWDGSEETNIEGVKGGLSGSMKRAAVQFGIGRYLYNLKENKVNFSDKGDNYAKYKVKDNNKEVWATGRWNTPKLPDWALPEGERGKKVQSEKRAAPPPTQSSGHETNNSNGSEKVAIKSQIDCINNLVKQIASSRNTSIDNVFSELRNRIYFTNVVEDLSFDAAATAIKLLSDWKTGGNK